MTYDKLIRRIQREIHGIYSDAEAGIAEAVSEYIEAVIPQEQEQNKEEEKSKLITALKTAGILEIAKQLYRINKRAKDTINGGVPKAFADMMNEESFLMEQEIGEEIGLFPVDEEDVAEWLEEYPEVFEIEELDERKDERWNVQNIRNTLITGVLLKIGGDKLTDFVTRRILKRNEDSMRRNAEDTISGAGEAGREASWRNAESKGQDILKEWVATLDFKTRDAHRQLDGNRVPLDQPFMVDGEEIRFPRDPQAKAYLRCNCRCAMRKVRRGWAMGERRENIRHPDGSGGWYKPIVPGMTYQEWYEMKVQELGEVEIQRQIKEMKREQQRKYYRKKKREKKGA